MKFGEPLTKSIRCSCGGVYIWHSGSKRFPNIPFYKCTKCYAKYRPEEFWDFYKKEDKDNG